MFFDSHAHLTSDELYPQIDEIIERAKKMNVKNIINICTDLKTLERGIELHKKYPWIYNAGSTTPHDVDAEGEKFFSAFEEAAKRDQLVAVGETGLDYYYTHSNRENQKLFFIRYLQLAKKSHLPIIIHCRDAFDDFFEIIDEHYPLKRKGVLHCFTGTLNDAKKLIERDWFISISAIATFKKSDELRRVVQEIPLDHMFIETDAPYLAPQSKRGKVNEPAFITETAEVVASLKNCHLQEVSERCASNCQEFIKQPK